MPVCVKDILETVNSIAPFRLAESWDNCGLQAGDPAWPVHRIMVCLDVSTGALAAAKKYQCDLLLSHHPLMMAPEKSLDFSRMPGMAVAVSAVEKMAIVSAHTNLDKAENGLNDYFARKIGIACTGPFLVEEIEDLEHPHAGVGRLGGIDPVCSLQALAEKIKLSLGIKRLRVIGNLASEIRDAAICTGSGGSLVTHFLKSKAQVYITGDLKYHDARDIESQGKSAIDVGHFASEHIVAQLLHEQLSSRLLSLGCELDIFEYKKDEDPFIII